MLRGRIAGTGSALPERTVTNEQLSERLPTSDEWIRSRTGIRERHILEEGRVTSDLAAEAGKAALRAAGRSPSEVDCIICCTVTPDMPMPATAVAVQQKLGAHCPAFDLSAACAGFVYGLSVGDAFIRARAFRTVLIIGVEVFSRFVDWNDRNTCVLFGDGAGAVLLVPSETDQGILTTHLFADGEQAHLLAIPGGGTAHPPSPESLEKGLHTVQMSGKAVFTHAVKNLTRASEIALEANGVRAEDIALVVAHQANQRILEGVAERTGIPMEKFFLNIQKYGNTSSASIPIALDEAVGQERLSTGQLVLFSALGSGFVWGSALLRW
jgi:3-oxoacyl-[acyl-carrier-protein] synthase-3